MKTGDPIDMTTVEVAALKWQAVPSSSNVQEIAHQHGASTGDLGNLFVRFRNGGIYRYDKVPAGDHVALLEADRDITGSVGRLLNSTVKTTNEAHIIRIVDPAPPAPAATVPATS